MFSFIFIHAWSERNLCALKIIVNMTTKLMKKLPSNCYYSPETLRHLPLIMKKKYNITADKECTKCVVLLCPKNKCQICSKKIVCLFLRSQFKNLVGSANKMTGPFQRLQKYKQSP